MTDAPKSNYQLAQQWLAAGSDLIVQATEAVKAEQFDASASLAGLAMVQITQAQVTATLASCEVQVQAANANNAAINGVGGAIVDAIRALAPEAMGALVSSMEHWHEVAGRHEVAATAAWRLWNATQDNDDGTLPAPEYLDGLLADRDAAMESYGTWMASQQQAAAEAEQNGD